MHVSLLLNASYFLDDILSNSLGTHGRLLQGGFISRESGSFLQKLIYGVFLLNGGGEDEEVRIWLAGQ